MAEQPKGMGRGLAAILSAAPRQEAEELRELPVASISPNPHQPRTSFTEEGLLSLSRSILSRGVVQPVLVRPLSDGRYELIAGERRWRAAQIAQLESVPAIVRRHDDASSLELALIENMARENLNAVEEARACAALVEELGLTREEVGIRVGRSRVAVSNLIRLLDLPDEVLALIEQGDLTEGHGRALLLAEHADRRRLAREAAASGWSVRELEQRARISRRSGGRSRSRAAEMHPDEAAAIEQIQDLLSQTLGIEVTARLNSGGYQIRMDFNSLEDAIAFARRQRMRAA